MHDFDLVERLMDIKKAENPLPWIRDGMESEDFHFTIRIVR